MKHVVSSSPLCKFSTFSQVTGTELDNRGLGEMVAALESEKSQLENALFDAQQTISGLETRQNLLVDEKEGLIARKENLLGKTFLLFVT